MMGLDFMVIFGALTFFFLRTATDADREECGTGAAGFPPPRSRVRMRSWAT